MNSLSRPEFEEGPPCIKQVVFDEAAITSRIDELALEMDRDYRGQAPVLVCILPGGVYFAQALSKRLTTPARFDSIRITPYEPDPLATAVRVIQDLQAEIRGEHVLLVGDIVDTGLSLNYLVQTLLERHPSSLRVCTLLDRPDLRLVSLPIGYIGFKVNDEFLVGYGLDYRGHYRHLPYLATLDVLSAQAFLVKEGTPRDFGKIDRACPE